MADRVIPNSLNYADIKPEAVEAEIKLVKFTPTSTVTGAKGGDIVKFLLVGNGFMDPYSTYLQFEVECTDLQENEVRFIDRSAHSFIQRMVIRSQGVEIERIENYDVVAAMIHDMIYSPEQCALHHWEGFANQQIDMNAVMPHNANVAQGLVQGSVVDGPRASDLLAGGGAGQLQQRTRGNACRARATLGQLIGNGASPIMSSYVGEMCFSNGISQGVTQVSGDSEYAGHYLLDPALFTVAAHISIAGNAYEQATEQALLLGAAAVSNNGQNMGAFRAALTVVLNTVQTYIVSGGLTLGGFTAAQFDAFFKRLTMIKMGQPDLFGSITNYPLDVDIFRDGAFAKDRERFGATMDALLTGLTLRNGHGNQELDTTKWMNGLTPHAEVLPLQYAGHRDGKRVASVAPQSLATNMVSIPAVRKMQFQIPIYSGLIGVLQPDKKLIPINLLPLDIEVTFNPHALYSSSLTGSRAYTITKFHMFSHMIFFEQEIHRSLEAAVAEHGIFLYCNQFHLAPVSLLANTTLPSFAYISMNLKSINSIHALFYYNAFETSPCARKLHFVSHNIKKLQILNGTTLIPQEPVFGNAGSSMDYGHTPFIIELYKAWNKLHDPRTDGAIEAYNYCGDQYGKQFDPIPFNLDTPDSVYNTLALLVNKQTHVGRCQYGISLEGEDLGTDKTMVTGRKSQYPFLLYMEGTKLSNRTSYMNVFLRADFIVYIRPDLQVVTLGK